MIFSRNEFVHFWVWTYERLTLLLVSWVSNNDLWLDETISWIWEARCQDLVRKYILRSHSMIPNSYAIKPENLTSPLDQRNAQQYNFVKQERWINMIVAPLKGKIMFKVIKKVVKLCVKLEYICNVVIADLFSKHSFSKLLSLIQYFFQA